MVSLFLGVTDIPYQIEPKVHAPPRITKKGTLHKGSAKRLARQYRSGAMAKSKSTTGDVAEVLEEHYHVFEKFYERYHAEIEQAFAQSMEDALVNLLAGAPPANNPYGDAENKVAELFQVFIESEELASLGVAGIPTKAALKGVNHRRAHPYAKSNPRRTSLVDTGLFLNSFQAWVGG